MAQHTVRYNESLQSLANEYGVTTERIRNHPDNSELFSKRQLSNCLAPGDELTMPEQAVQQTLILNSLNTLVVDDKHYFLPVKIVDHNLQPVAGLELRFTWAGEPDYVANQTNSQGIVTFQVPAECEKSMLAYQWQGETRYFLIKVGTLLPPEMNEGLLQRFCNLYGLAFDARQCRRIDASTVQRQMQNQAEEYNKTTDELLTLLVGKD
jgi:hypothetical protein